MTDEGRNEAAGRALLQMQGFNPRDDRPIGTGWIKAASEILAAADAWDREHGWFRVQIPGPSSPVGTTGDQK
jgi:hypothetical protein